MILESVILFRIENFQKGCAWITSEVSSQLIYLVQKQHRINCSGFFHHLNNLPRQCTDISAPVATNLGLIAHSTERESHKLTVSGACDRFSQTCLSDSWRADKTEYRAFRVLNQLAHGKILKNPFFDFFHSKVVFVENLLGLDEILNLLGFLLPL